MRTVGLAVIGLVIVLAPTTVRSEVARDGNEFQANTYTPGSQRRPSVASTGAGGFIVVWESQPPPRFPGPDGDGAGVFAQRYDAIGARAGTQFQVNVGTLGWQQAPSVAADATGRFVVAWETTGIDADGSESGAFLRLFDADGTPRSGDLQANTYTSSEQRHPTVAVAPGGNFVVAWESGSSGYLGEPPSQDGDDEGVFAQRFDATGTRVGGELQVNSLTAGPQRNAAVGIDASGRFVVAWESGGYRDPADGDLAGIFARRFDAAGVPFGAEFQVNTFTADDQTNPAIAVGPGGGFVVVWQSGGYYDDGPDGSRESIVARRFDANGVPQGDEFVVNTFTPDNQRVPAVALDGTGNFVVSWQTGSYGPTTPDGNVTSVAARHFTADGAPLGDEFQVNTYTTGDQGSPAVTADATGRFVITWNSGGYYGPPQDRSGAGVFGQRYRTTAFTAPAGVRGARLRITDHPTDPTRRRFAVTTDDDAIDLGAGPGSIDDPTIGGAMLRVRSATFDHTYRLPAANWRAIRQGWQYDDRRLGAGPIRRARVKAGRLASASGLGAQLAHSLGVSPEPVDVILQTGDGGQRWCMTFGGVTRFVPQRVFAASDAAAPARGVCQP